MAYIVKRKDLHYVVAYDGVDPLTGRERRRWHPAGTNDRDADALLIRLDRLERTDCRRRSTSAVLGSFLTDTWLPRKRASVRATTAYRYGWMVEHYLVPRIGTIRLDQLRADHLDDLYGQLLANGGKDGRPLSQKTVHEVHVVVRNALDLAVRRQLVDRNVALATYSPRRRGGGSVVARTWNPHELATFLGAAELQRLLPALHLTAHTGMRRGETIGLRWNDLDVTARRVSICRTVQSVAGRPTEFGAKTRTSRRCIDLDDTTLAALDDWRRRLEADGLPYGPDDWMFCNTAGRCLNPDSLTQLFTRLVKRSGLPRIRLHDLRHTHATLLIAAGVPVKVVCERLGHAHPGFTMQTYQHVLPGMGAQAANCFADLVTRAGR